MTVVTAVAGLGGCWVRSDAPLEPTTDRPVGQWVEMAASPLSPRAGSAGVWTGEQLLVVGGRTGDPCPPDADCAQDLGEVLADGAAYDPGSDAWHRIADAPVPFADAQAVRVGDELVVVAGATTLAYTPATDRWRELPAAPPSDREAAPPVVVGDLVVLPTYDKQRRERSTDRVLDLGTGTWSMLPADPFGESYDRSMAWDGERLWLLSMAVESHFGAYEGSPSRLAVLEGGSEGGLTTGTWRVVETSTPLLTYGQLAWWGDGRLVVTPSNGQPARAYDPATSAWDEAPSTEGESCTLPPAGVGRTWVAGGGPDLASRDGLRATSVDPCPSLPEADVAVWADDLLLVWGGPDQGYDGNTAAGLVWRAPVTP